MIHSHSRKKLRGKKRRVRAWRRLAAAKALYPYRATHFWIDEAATCDFTVEAIFCGDTMIYSAKVQPAQEEA